MFSPPKTYLICVLFLHRPKKVDTTSLGYGLAMCLFAGLREHLAGCDVPRAFKGLPIALITVGIMAMAFLGFSGIV